MVKDDRWDGIVIATHVSGTPVALKQSLELNVPILVEKPVAWTSQELQSIRQNAHEQVIVGYNRRYYDPVQTAREFLSDHRPTITTAEFPAASDIRSFIGMSSHGIDLLRHLFGELDVLRTHVLTQDSELRGYSAVLESDSDDLVTVIGNWEASSNIGINIDYGETRLQLEPYEQATKFEGFEIKEPTEDMPIRQYHPQQVQQTNLDPTSEKYKPGFYEQASAYKKIITNGSINERSATLSDAEKVLQLCEQLLPDHLPNKAPISESMNKEVDESNS
jgi:predicted dehydrogenase